MLNSPRTRPSPHSTARPTARTRSRRRAAAGLLAALITVPLSVLSGASPAAADDNPVDASKFKGVNWAMPEDNYQSEPIVPEGLEASDDYDTVKAKANAILSGFQSTTGANTVRLPINIHTIPGTTWGDKYAGAIDAATDMGFKVILSYWEGDGVDENNDGKPDGPGRDGKIVDMDAFKSMWKAVTDAYKDNSQVYFELLNEPYAIDPKDWANIAATWIADNPSIPKNRIIVSGERWNGDVTSYCADERLNGTYLSFHHYAFNNDEKTYDEWVEDFKRQVGNCGKRTILDEFGAPMDDGRDYNDADSTDNFVRYLRAETDTVLELGMGAVQWPALGGKHGSRPKPEYDGHDWYSLFHLEGSGTDLALGVRNISGIERLKYAFGIDADARTSVLRNVDAGQCLDAPDNATSSVKVADCDGTDAQKWTRMPSALIKVGGNKCLYAASSGDGSHVGTTDCDDRDHRQKWMFYSDETIRSVHPMTPPKAEEPAPLCLDKDLASSRVQLYKCWGGKNQQWNIKTS
ncbi:cellulase family glycosylhydrolase [Nonomuraea sp. NBC_00507]|uniref:ricin-type beta-trefoil lectin domain protein n=1 Tax=Nonomuraea sp. NBC_00507 TaxID=2976002 RepID=UPI002E17337D